MSPTHNGVPLGANSPLLTKGGAKRVLQRREKLVEDEGDRLMAAYGFVAVRYYHITRHLAVWWEAKAERGRQRPAQRTFQLMVEEVGERYLVGGVDVLMAWLRERNFRSFP